MPEVTAVRNGRTRGHLLLLLLNRSPSRDTVYEIDEFYLSVHDRNIVILSHKASAKALILEWYSKWRRTLRSVMPY